MINSLKTIAVLSCAISANYRRSFCNEINIAAKEYGYNVVYFCFIGKIGGVYEVYAEHEGKLMDIIPYDELAGIIFDNESFTYKKTCDELADHVRRNAKCPVISVTGFVEGFININYDDCGGVRDMVRHMIEVHGAKRLGYMSGPLRHHDAVPRYEAFKETMKEYGLPEDGVGMFEGDFWYNRGKEAVKFFWDECEQRPEAIICGNDYMAMSLCDAFRERGIRVPEDVMIAGFDGSEEGQRFIPSITTTDRRRKDIAWKAVEIIDAVNNGRKYDINAALVSSNIYRQSCGCMKADFCEEMKKVNSNMLDLNRTFIYFLSHMEVSTLKNNTVNDIGMISEIFEEHAINFGEYESFYFMVYADDEGNTSCEKAVYRPTSKAVPAVWIDRSGKLKKPEGTMPVSRLLPECSSDEPQFYYISDIHSGDKCFGYTVVSMTGEGPFNDFYSAWILNIAVSMESLFKQNSITKLIGDLEDASIKDELTGLFNRRGFESRSEEIFSRTEEGSTVCTVVIDMDGLKGINDEYGHSEGDSAIRTLGRVIAECCDDKEVAGRTGGDEFYIFAANYTKEKLDSFMKRFNSRLEVLNQSSGKPYDISASCGTLLEKIGVYSNIEDYLKISDERMYKIKRSKHRRRR